MYTGISVVVFVAVGVIFEICRRLLAASMDKWIASKKIEGINPEEHLPLT